MAASFGALSIHSLIKHEAQFWLSGNYHGKFQRASVLLALRIAQIWLSGNYHGKSQRASVLLALRIAQRCSEVV